MGLFDTINVFQECPYCKKQAVFEFQTKDLDGGSMLDFDTVDKIASKLHKARPRWSERAQVDKELVKGFTFVEGTASCTSPLCAYVAAMRDMVWQGCKSGFGRFFDGKIAIKSHKGQKYFFGDIYDIKKDGINIDKLNEMWIEFIPVKIYDTFHKFAEKNYFGQEAIAIHFFNFYKYRKKIQKSKEDDKEILRDVHDAIFGR